MGVGGVERQRDGGKDENAEKARRERERMR